MRLGRGVGDHRVLIQHAMVCIVQLIGHSGRELCIDRILRHQLANGLLDDGSLARILGSFQRAAFVLQ